MGLPKPLIVAAGAGVAGLAAGAAASAVALRRRSAPKDPVSLLQPLFERAHERMHEEQARPPRSASLGAALRRLVLLGAAGAGSYAGARALLKRDRPPQGLPGPVQGFAERAHSRLHRAEQVAVEALDEARAERATAERELTAEYRRRAQGNAPRR